MPIPKYTDVYACAPFSPLFILLKHCSRVPYPRYTRMIADNPSTFRRQACLTGRLAGRHACWSKSGILRNLSSYYHEWPTPFSTPFPLQRTCSCYVFLLPYPPLPLTTCIACRHQHCSLVRHSAQYAVRQMQGAHSLLPHTSTQLNHASELLPSVPLSFSHCLQAPTTLAWQASCATCRLTTTRSPPCCSSSRQRRGSCTWARGCCRSRPTTQRGSSCQVTPDILLYTVDRDRQF